MEKNNKVKKILLVDDNEIELSLTENVLNNEYEIIKAKSGKEALEYLLKGNVPNLILLDILMPQLDGWETYDRVRAITFLHDVPIAFLTSVDESSKVDHAYEIGASDYILKPYNAKDLIIRIATIMKKYEN